ncbi:response regulator transcription factor [Oricola thermophila]|uniref:HTH luxR-type domain-containing protein n=1 Tax=Oricola thermophila TaxID=2742145 RepID=A0A6N1VFQ5_9HYPH|nr:LuxR C-terminal-related transcriptional regulator [Oricola thermophila]QKV19741.1 hypothetical protein HTY61_15405 [Oricola thermophila]
MSMQAVEAIGAARTGYDIFKALKLCLPGFRLPYFGIFVASDSARADILNRVALTNWDSEVVHRCLENDSGSWPFVPPCVGSVLPHSIVLREKPGEGAGSGPGDLAGFLRSSGHEAFVFVPTRSSTGRRGGVSFSGARELVESDEVMALDFIARHAFERLMSIMSGPGDRENPLSARELECLGAAARGYSSLETADRIGITAYTVNYHLSNAVRKLDARTKTQAVAEAIRSGWLDRW